MPDFTKDKWTLFRNADGNFSISANGHVIAEAFTDFDGEAIEEADANARLIANAPVMYNFIRVVYDLFTNPDDDEEGLSFRHTPDVAKQILNIIDGKEWNA